MIICVIIAQDLPQKTKAQVVTSGAFTGQAATSLGHQLDTAALLCGAATTYWAAGPAAPTAPLTSELWGSNSAGKYRRKNIGKLRKRNQNQQTHGKKYNTQVIQHIKIRNRTKKIICKRRSKAVLLFGFPRLQYTFKRKITINPVANL